MPQCESRCQSPWSRKFPICLTTPRIKAWCVAGLGLEDGDDARQLHMDPAFFNPRTVATGDLQTMEELNALVNA